MEKLTDERLAKGKKIAFTSTAFGLLVFGGVDGGDAENATAAVCKDAFAITFSKLKNKAAWAAVGAAPVTRACLPSDLVRHDSKDDPLYDVC